MITTLTRINKEIPKISLIVFTQDSLTFPSIISKAILFIIIELCSRSISNIPHLSIVITVFHFTTIKPPEHAAYSEYSIW